MSEEKVRNPFDTARTVMAYIYAVGGALVFCTLFFLVYHFGLLNFFYMLFFFWIGFYLFFARSFVMSIKSRRAQWGKVRCDLAVALIRAPMTAVNLMFIWMYFANMSIPVFWWGFLLFAWSMFPCFKLIDYLEEKICS